MIMIESIIINVFQTGLIGSIIFLVMIAIVGLSGIADATRTPEGKFRKKFSIKSIIGFGVFVSFILILLYYGNKNLIERIDDVPPFYILYLNSMLIYSFLMLFDLFVLDYLIIVKWHPKFLKLPDTEYYTKFKPHLKGFGRGILIGLVFSGLVSYITISIG